MIAGILPAAAFALLCGLMCGPAEALTGNTLLKACSQPKSKNGTFLYDDAFCNGYISSARDFADRIGSPQPNGICLPVGIDQAKLRGLVVQYLIGHPKTRNEQAPQIILSALREAFPCQT